MLVVEVADEFGMTTADALAVCDRAGIVATDGGTDLSAAEVERFRAAAAQPPPSEPEPPRAAPAWTNDAPVRPADPMVVPTPTTYRASTPRRQYNVWGFVSLACGLIPIAGLYFGWGAPLLAIPSLVTGRWADEFEAQRRPDRTGFSMTAMLGRVMGVFIAFACMAAILAWNTGHLDTRPSTYVADVLSGRRPLIPPSQGQPGRGGGAGSAGDVGDVGVDSIRAGACYSVVGAASTAAVRADQLVATSCATLHDLEVVHVYRAGSLDTSAARPLALAANPDAPEVHEAVRRACDPEYRSLVSPVGQPYGLASIAPGAAEWDGGNRTVVCALSGPAGQPTAGAITADG